MDIPPKIVFNVTTLGASHIKDSRPCQDYSISWEDGNSGAAAIIVCDGHGSETCVRSDVGARLAAEISLNCIKQFISCSPEWLLNKKGAVTAREQDADIRFETKAAKPVNDMTEIEAQRFRQRLTFIDQIKDLHDQDAIFEALFSSIHDKWIEAIELDSKEKPFSQEELSRLADNKLVKAYGTTLMAYIQTPLYWFAFHIGDGRILECDRHMNWKQSVPWDCSCFLNHTTSLCTPSLSHLSDMHSTLQVIFLQPYSAAVTVWKILGVIMTWHQKSYTIIAPTFFAYFWKKARSQLLKN